MHRIVTILIVTTMVVAGCNWFEDPSDIETCPLNSAYPCPCDTKCETQGHVCRLLKNGKGQCTIPCSTTTNDATDRDSTNICNDQKIAQGYSGICLSDGYCTSTCTQDRDCPPGLMCDNKMCVIDGFAWEDTSDNDTTDSNTSDSDSSDIDSETDTTIPQRQTECGDLCDLTNTCAPGSLKITLDKCKGDCVEGNWHQDPCGICKLDCNTWAGDCNQWLACFAACQSGAACTTDSN